jgi:hypothetical protein
MAAAAAVTLPTKQKRSRAPSVGNPSRPDLKKYKDIDGDAQTLSSLNKGTPLSSIVENNSAAEKSMETAVDSENLLELLASSDLTVESAAATATSSTTNAAAELDSSDLAEFLSVTAGFNSPPTTTLSSFGTNDVPIAPSTSIPQQRVLTQVRASTPSFAPNLLSGGASIERVNSAPILGSSPTFSQGTPYSSFQHQQLQQQHLNSGIQRPLSALSQLHQRNLSVATPTPNTPTLQAQVPMATQAGILPSPAMSPATIPASLLKTGTASAPSSTSMPNNIFFHQHQDPHHHYQNQQTLIQSPIPTPNSLSTTPILTPGTMMTNTNARPIAIPSHFKRPSTPLVLSSSVPCSSSSPLMASGSPSPYMQHHQPHQHHQHSYGGSGNVLFIHQQSPSVQIHAQQMQMQMQMQQQHGVSSNMQFGGSEIMTSHSANLIPPQPQHPQHREPMSAMMPNINNGSGALTVPMHVPMPGHSTMMMPMQSQSPMQMPMQMQMGSSVPMNGMMFASPQQHLQHQRVMNVHQLPQRPASTPPLRGSGFGGNAALGMVNREDASMERAKAPEAMRMQMMMGDGEEMETDRFMLLLEDEGANMMMASDPSHLSLSPDMEGGKKEMSASPLLFSGRISKGVTESPSMQSPMLKQEQHEQFLSVTNTVNTTTNSNIQQKPFIDKILASVSDKPPPFKCPRPFCSKIYKNLNGLKYHLQEGKCELEATATPSLSVSGGHSNFLNSMYGVSGPGNGGIGSQGGSVLKKKEAVLEVAKEKVREMGLGIHFGGGKNDTHLLSSLSSSATPLTPPNNNNNNNDQEATEDVPITATNSSDHIVDPSMAGVSSEDLAELSNLSDISELLGDIKIVSRPYFCKVPGCHKKYKNLNGLKYHAKVSHADMNFKKEVKGFGSQSKSLTNDVQSYTTTVAAAAAAAVEGVGL